MKRFMPVIAFGVLLAAVALPIAAAATAPGMKVAGTSDLVSMAGSLSAITGIAISPLLGTGGYGAYLWFRAPDEAARAALPWFAQVGFWLPALLIVAACAAKDALGATLPPGWKKPLDVLETVENKTSGLIAAGAVVPLTMMSLSKMIVDSNPSASTEMVSSGLAMLPLGSLDTSWLLNLLTVPAGIAIFAVVWLASHAINVLILLSPWGAIDAALKAGRTALLGLLTVGATIDPWVGAGLSVVVIVFAYFVAGWSFRLSVFGWVFCWDFLTLRRRRFVPRRDSNLMFACGDLADVPARTYGHLGTNPAGQLEFVYRPWLWLPARTAAVPLERADMAVGQGLFCSNISRADGDAFFLLPPRYRGHEDEVASIYGAGHGVQPAGLRKAWNAMRELFFGCAAQPQLPSPGEQRQLA